MTTPLRRPDSRAERIQSLILKELDGLSRQTYSAARKGEDAREALSKLRPHVEAELESLETLEWLRDLTDEELARRRTFAMLLSVVGRSSEQSKSARERILALLRLGAATNSELQKLAGVSLSTIRNNLCELINDGEVVAGRGRPKTYRLASSVSKPRGSKVARERGGCEEEIMEAIAESH